MARTVPLIALEPSVPTLCGTRDRVDRCEGDQTLERAHELEALPHRSRRESDGGEDKPLRQALHKDLLFGSRNNTFVFGAEPPRCLAISATTLENFNSGSYRRYPTKSPSCLFVQARCDRSGCGS